MTRNTMEENRAEKQDRESGGWVEKQDQEEILENLLIEHMLKEVRE